LPASFYLRRREQLLYLVVGGWNTVFGYFIWAALQLLLGNHLHYLVVMLIAWPIAVLNAYFGYRFIVFRCRGSILREFPISNQAICIWRRQRTSTEASSPA
jgi:putative flippase GtrA